MGDARKEALRVDLDSQIKLEFHGAAITPDAGLVAYRELDEALELTTIADDLFRDPRRGKDTQHELTGILPDGRGGGAAQAVRRDPGPHPATAPCGQHGPFMMTRQAPQNGSRCDDPRGCPALGRGNGAWLGILQARGRRKNGSKSRGTAKKVREVVGATGGAV